MKKTKVIATVGPTSKDKEILRQMILKGMDIVRVNMSHSSHEFLKGIVDTIQELNHELHTCVSVMVDTNGPTIQVGRIDKNYAYINTGDKIRIYADDILGDSTKFSVSYPNLLHEVKMHTILKINDGLVTLKVVEKGLNYLLCEVLEGGVVESFKKVNVLNTNLAMPFLSLKDRNDILYASSLHVDFLALSFVKSHEDVLEVNDLLINADDSHLTIVTKIENAMAVEDMDEIIRTSDAIMIARGDLGVELPLERIPGLQKTIIHKCHYMGKPSLVATEMMTSMAVETRPTRAEVSDVANAVEDGVDGVVLTGETTVGKHPVEVIDMIARIVSTAEQDMNYHQFLDTAFRTEKQDTTGSIAYSVVDCANRLKCKAIVAPTMSGYTARKISRFRPTCPIVAMSPDLDTVRSLNIYYGVYPCLIKDRLNFDQMMELAREKAMQLLALPKGEKIIITGGYPFREVKHTNFMKIEEL